MAVCAVCGSPASEGTLSAESQELRQIDGMQAYFGSVHQAGGATLLHPGGDGPGSGNGPEGVGGYPVGASSSLPGARHCGESVKPNVIK